MLAPTLIVPGLTAASVVPPITEQIITNPEMVARLRMTKNAAP